MSSGVILFSIFFQGAYGTFFPPLNNPPPIPAQSVRTLDNSPPGFYVQEDLQQEFAQPLVKDEGLFPPDFKPDEQRWIIQENQSDEFSPVPRSADTFDRYYSSGEPAIGPVATPIPDDTYLAQPSSISKLSPNDPANSDIWILTRGADSQYIPQRWVQVQLPAERFVEVNQDTGPPIATKSIVGLHPAEVPVKTQFTANTPANIIQQVWVQSPKSAGSQLYENPPDIVEGISSVKQIVDIPPANVKQVVQQQIIKDGSPVPLTPSPPFSPGKSFSAPPPLPPPLKGLDAPSKSVSPVNVIPDSNIVFDGKNALYQRLRHVWIPTSSRTGKFISFPVSPTVNAGKSVINSGLTLDSTPVTVSDTWVLKQEGPFPSFEQQKSISPPPVVQSGKVIFKDPPVIQIDDPTGPPIVAEINSPKNLGITGKSVGLNAPIGIWPNRKDISSKVIGKSPAAIVSELSVSPPKFDRVSFSQPFPVPPLAPQKTLINPKSPSPPPLPSPPVQFVNGKPCPIPPLAPQKVLFSPGRPAMYAIPRVLENQKRIPMARIIRVNRYPSGGYYLLNTGIRPNYSNYPNPAGLVRIVQTKQIPFQLQSKQTVVPVQTKQISIPVQSKQFVAPIPARQVLFPFQTGQIAASPKSTRIIYPTVQAIRYAYPWSSNYSPVPGKGIHILPFTSLKAPPTVAISDSTSSESSSESSSSESKEKKGDKLKKEEKPQNEESDSSDEREKEPSSKETEKESKENTSESKSEESIEAAESQMSHDPANTVAFAFTEHGLTENAHISRIGHHEQINTASHHQDGDGRVTVPYSHNYHEGFYSVANHEADREGMGVPVESSEPRTTTHEGEHANFILNHVTNPGDKTHHGLQGSTDSMTTDLVRD